MSRKTKFPPEQAAPETEALNNSPESTSALLDNAVDKWSEARAAYPIYAALAKQCELSEVQYPAGQLPPSKPTREIFERDLQWLDEIDAKIKAFQIRQLPPATINAHEEPLRSFIHRQLRKPDKSESDRDKIDFLIVQYFALCAPETMYHEEITLEDVARVLEPVLWNSDSAPVEWCSQLEIILHSVKECRSLRDLLENGVLEQGRLLKESSGPLFYDPAALITFARFNFLMRRAFIRLLHTDQDAVIKAVDELERAGVRSVDCRRAGYSAAESIGSLRLFAQNWRPLYQKDYAENAVNRSFEQLLALRADLEDAVAKLHLQFAEPAASAETELQSASHENAAVATEPEKAPTADAAPELETEAESQGDATSQENAIEATNVSPESALESASLPIADESAAPLVPVHEIAGEPVKVMDPSAPTPSAEDTASPKADPAGASEPVTHVPAEAEACLKSILEQLTAAAPSRGRSMSTIVLKNSKVLLSSWEVAAFVSDTGQDSEDLRRAVVARGMIALAMDSRKQTGETESLGKALAWARAEVSYFQGRIEQSKLSKSIEAVVNLGISTKRLLSFMEEAEKLQP
ncbi:MAG TPA: hypothetical protein VIH76_14835 [Candidatus Acidoferrales bacterium]